MSHKDRLIAHIDWALSKDITPEWRDSLIIACSEVLNRYPFFNSNSTLPVTCPVCGTTRELEVHNLYNLKGMDECLICHGKRVAPGAIIASLSTPAHRAASIENAKKARSAKTPESYKKGWQTRRSNNQ